MQLDSNAEEHQEVQLMRKRLHKFWTVTVNQVKAQNVEEVDRADENDTQQVAEYCGPILKHLLATEHQDLPT